MSQKKTDPFAMDVTLDSLAASTTAGRQTVQRVVDTSRNINDITANWEIVSGSFVGTASTKVDVYVWGTADSVGFPGMAAAIELITGLDAAVTLSTLGLVGLTFLKSTLFLQASGAGTARGEASIVAALGFIPRRFGLVFINNTGAALAASGHTVECVEHYYD